MKQAGSVAFGLPPGLAGTCFGEKEKESARSTNRLLFVSLMTDPVCNLECPDCYVGQKERGSKELTLDERRAVLDQARTLGARTLRVAGEGEPMLDEDFFQMVEYAAKIGLNVFFFTNGTLIDETAAAMLHENRRVSMATKFCGPPELMERLTGGRGHFAGNKFVEHDGLLIPKTLKILIDEGFNKPDCDGNSRLGIEFLLRKSNYEYAADIFRWARRNGIVPYIEQMLEAGGAWDFLDERVDDKDAYRLSKILLEIDRNEFGHAWLPGIPYLAGGISENEKSGCKKYGYNIVISSKGDVYPCYAATLQLGNVREKPLSEILENPHRKQLISDIRYNCLCRVFNRTLKKRAIHSPSDLCKKFDYKVDCDGR